MVAKVVDASAIAAVLFAEPNWQAVEARLAGANLVAPALIHFELANVCLQKIKRESARRDDLLAAFGMLARMQIAIRSVHHLAAIRLAEQTKLSLYDATYLWLAQALDAELVTLDLRLEAAHKSLRS